VHSFLKFQPEFIICVYEAKKDHWVSKEILQNGTWEPGISLTIKLLLEQADKDILFLDIGANLGIHSLYAAKLGYRVVAIEPQENNLIKVDIS
jgi:2-polyprenyl-3-methyl-5-hydroxy-6-metoxy-1,4-benzoquinol methylase